MYQSYLQLHLAKGVGEATIRRLVVKLNQTGTDLEDFLAYPVKKMTDFGLNETQAKSISDARNILDKVNDELEQHQVKMIALNSSNYPVKLKERLASNTPSLLYAWGNIELLNNKMIGFCGSRNVSEKGIEVAKDCSEQVSSWSWATISGGARGVDTTVHVTTLKTKGSTVIVLPEGILKYKTQPALSNLVDSKNTLLLSEFPPKMPWSVANAMQRNKVICGLSEALIVIESGMKGGTFEAGTEALKLKVPLFVADYAAPSDSAKGNAYFISRGAYILRRKGETGRANLGVMKNLIEKLEKSQVVQPELFGK